MKERNIAVAIVLSIVTCGIYGIYWFIVQTDEAKELAGDQETASGAVAFLLTLVTCGIYGFYWAYVRGQNVNDMSGSQNNEIIYLVLSIIGLQIVVYALMQNEINKVIADGGVATGSSNHDFSADIKKTVENAGASAEKAAYIVSNTAQDAVTQVTGVASNAASKVSDVASHVSESLEERAEAGKEAAAAKAQKEAAKAQEEVAKLQEKMDDFSIDESVDDRID